MDKRSIVIIIVKNSLGQLFVHQRSKNKIIFPLLYGIGAGGKVDDGEEPKQAAQRELEEELGLKTRIEFLFKVDFRSKEIARLIHVFQTLCDQEVRARGREFQWSGWLTFKEIDQLVKDKKLCPDTEIIYKKYKTEYYDQ